MEDGVGQQRGVLDVPQDRGLYSFRNEHDACGVGMVANLDNKAEHAIIENGLTVLKRLMHRGAAGGDPETGDGAGLLFSIPDKFFRKVLKKTKLPPVGQYGVAVVFGGKGYEKAIEKIAETEGVKTLVWREVPVHPEFIGHSARETCPVIRQLFLDGSAFTDRAVFERKLFIIRRLIEKNVADCYLPSCSCKSIVYKGLLLATQIDKFYSDLGDADMESPLVLVHQRYSTNTFPTWKLAHPYRYLAHNGEINTLRGNLNQLHGREPFLDSPLFGDDIKKLLPLVQEGQSDSASLDNMLELLVASGRSLPHAMLMLMPQAWGVNYHLGRDVRGFFDYHSELMEPWDGPAAVGFSDGVNLGAILDRNGLRPARYTLTKGGMFVLASETGVLDIDDADVVKKGRLKPGEMIWCDLEHGRLVNDTEIKNTIARRLPYRRWADENKIVISGLFDSVNASAVSLDLTKRQRLFGWTREDLEVILLPMSTAGEEPVGSMGNDASLAVLSSQPQPLFNYFKQLFAQVTNPPIDSIREELVMSLTTYIGNQGNILSEEAQRKSIIRLPRPILTDEDVYRLGLVNEINVSIGTLNLGWSGDLEAAVKTLQQNAVDEVKAGRNILILSDRSLASKELPIPSLLATAAVNRALVEAGLRPPIGLIIQSGEVREVMHYALLLGYGATAIHPYLALETVSALSSSGRTNCDPAKATENYIKAVDKGLMKVMSKMGISTLRSYRSAQIFEAVGLNADVIDRYFPGTASRVAGLSLADIAAESRLRHEKAQESAQDDVLPAGGQYRIRKDGENHLWTPESLSLFRQAVQTNNVEKYRQYAKFINHQEEHLCTLRGLFDFVEATPVPLSEVESVDSIVRHFVTGAMSLGSLSPEAHEAIAIAMNRLGGMSNCGEGGEDPDREKPGANGEDRRSAIRQVASGRFGVTINYLAGAKELQIKMAQGAKPGEGGQLPGHKVDEAIARVRHSMPFVTLISPPPHHDIYSIEDLAQLIFDLHNANKEARVSVKLVSEVGVGTVAAGVAKGHAEVILISGHDGGTGASPLTSIKHAGLPWELGLAEAQQTLVLNNLRERVKLQVDGQIKTGRDVVIGALLGAEEFGFATTALVCLGCVMMRKCHENNCPVGVATQDPQLRKCFTGKPEYIENFLRLLAQEVREYLAQLGFRSLDEAVGRSDMIRTNRAIEFYKTHNLDFTKMLARAEGPAVRWNGRKEAVETYDAVNLIPELGEAIKSGKKVVLNKTIRNVNRTVGTQLSCDIVRIHGAAGLPEGTITVNFQGCAGQSFGAFLTRGITLNLEGEANDFVGKGLSGGTIVIKPSATAKFVAKDNVVAGNVIGFGGTSGKIFLNGQAGERFAIRNSGITSVVEGVGDHGCEYMTGGRVVVLGPTGVNFGAGMTGGLAYVYDYVNDFDLRCNVGTVDLETVAEGSEDEAELKALIAEHIEHTGSPWAQTLLADWVNVRGRFVKVIPVEYKQALAKIKAAQAKQAR